jgi:uncharacterized protein involved in exopolysaccharide biosynthesis
MNIANAWLVLALATPIAALAQTSHSTARIESPVLSGPVHACMERQETLADRKAYLDQEKYEIDRNGDAIARDGASLADELRRMPSSDVAAVAAYNTRSDAHNRRVAEHNRRVADMNAAAASLNGDSADLMAYCNFRYMR